MGKNYFYDEKFVIFNYYFINPLTYNLRSGILGRKRKQAIIYYIWPDCARNIYVWSDNRTTGHARSCRLRD